MGPCVCGIGEQRVRGRSFMSPFSPCFFVRVLVGENLDRPRGENLLTNPRILPHAQSASRWRRGVEAGAVGDGLARGGSVAAATGGDGRGWTRVGDDRRRWARPETDRRGAAALSEEPVGGIGIRDGGGSHLAPSDEDDGGSQLAPSVEDAWTQTQRWIARLSNPPWSLDRRGGRPHWWLPLISPQCLAVKSTMTSCRSSTCVRSSSTCGGHAPVPKAPPPRLVLHQAGQDGRDPGQGRPNRVAGGGFRASNDDLERVHRCHGEQCCKTRFRAAPQGGERKSANAYGRKSSSADREPFSSLQLWCCTVPR
nr:uncharacterized protein LOC127322133 isoform X2 [Lolium perenne]XP_051207054.1 uncharacterized protein LOC127322133 isoform X2 [Lolium perenne]